MHPKEYQLRRVIPLNFTHTQECATDRMRSFIRSTLNISIKIISVLGAWGPLARDVDSVILASQILFDGKEANKIDPMVAPLPFNDEVSIYI